ncbi:MAG: hypothetical protein WD425_13970 [Nitrospirales bacterium]
MVAKDNTVRYGGLSLQLPQDPHRFHYVKVTVRVHAYPDASLAVFHGPRCLARYQSDGRFIEPQAAHRGRRGPTHGSDDHPIVELRPTVCKKIRARHG